MQVTRNRLTNPSSLSPEAFTRSMQLTISMPTTSGSDVATVRPDLDAALAITVILGSFWANKVPFTTPVSLEDGGVGCVFYTADRPNIVEAYNDGEIIISFHTNNEPVRPYSTHNLSEALEYVLKRLNV